MKFGFVQKVEQIALADGRSIKSVGSIEPDIGLQGLAAQSETCQTVDLTMACAIKPLLIANNNEPMVSGKPLGPAFPYVPLSDFHRSGFCFALLIDRSNFTR